MISLWKEEILSLHKLLWKDCLQKASDYGRIQSKKRNTKKTKTKIDQEINLYTFSQLTTLHRRQRINQETRMWNIRLVVIIALRRKRIAINRIRIIVASNLGKGLLCYNIVRAQQT